MRNLHRIPMADIDFQEHHTPIEGTFLPTRDFYLHSDREQKWQRMMLFITLANSAAAAVLAVVFALHW